jgi:rhodanese-related sulfurtransferase
MMNARDFKDAVFGQFARMAQAFASPKRLEILDVLAQGERDVETLARETSQSVVNASRHLQVLKNARLVEGRKQSVHVYYRLADPDVARCWQSLQKLAEKRSAEVGDVARRFFAERDGLEPVSRTELLNRARAGEVIVLDVRPSEEYASGHIRGSLSVPLPELRRRLNSFAQDREIVAYCRGPYCVLAAEAVALLRRSGRAARRFAEGFPEWRAAGQPIERGED